MRRAAKYIALLGVCLAATAAAAGIVAARKYGDGAYLASGLAAALVWALGGASLAMVARASTQHGRLNAALLGMLIRMSLPMVAVLYFSSAGGPLAAAGISSLILVHYLAGLGIETVFCVRLIRAAEVAAEPSAAAFSSIH